MKINRIAITRTILKI